VGHRLADRAEVEWPIHKPGGKNPRRLKANKGQFQALGAFITQSGGWPM